MYESSWQGWAEEFLQTDPAEPAVPGTPDVATLHALIKEVMQVFQWNPPEE